MATEASGSAASLAIGLHGNGTLSISPGLLVSARVSYPMVDIAWAGLVNDPAAPQSAQPLPAIAWRMANGQYASATPARPTDAWQVLEALFTYRPDLRIPLPPPPGYGYPPAYASYGAYAPYGYAQQQRQPDDNQHVMAGLAHLSIFFGALIVPLILWLVNRGKAPYAAQQSKQAFFFHLVLWVVELVLIVPAMVIYFTNFFTFMDSTAHSTQPPVFPLTAFSGVFILYGILFVVGIVSIVFGIIGAVHAFKGEPFHYPLMGRI
ncbi:MAG TPA: DUF4870 domain-containing protein [Ktedonobacterales bacterium]|nr:DUF4870 domain-containing protein [Ktedonobacterales bacterium]